MLRDKKYKQIWFKSNFKSGSEFKRTLKNFEFIKGLLEETQTCLWKRKKGGI